MRPYSFGIFLLVAHMVYLVNGKNNYDMVAAVKEEKISCRATKMQMNDLKMQSGCMPRTVLVKLDPPSGYAYYPDVVPLNRCHGYCHNDVSCMAISKNITSVVVMHGKLDEEDLRCQKIYLEEHTACKCLCNVMPQDCKKNQKYIPDDCECKCTNMEAKRKCSKMPKRKWNPEHCKCMCDMNEEECSTGLAWVPAVCKCMPIDMTHMNSI